MLIWSFCLRVMQYIIKRCYVQKSSFGNKQIIYAYENFSWLCVEICIFQYGHFNFQIIIRKFPQFSFLTFSHETLHINKYHKRNDWLLIFILIFYECIENRFRTRRFPKLNKYYRVSDVICVWSRHWNAMFVHLYSSHNTPIWMNYEHKQRDLLHSKLFITHKFIFTCRPSCI